MAVDAAEVRLSDLPNHYAGLVAISQSGERKDVHRAVVLASQLSLPTLSVVNTVGSLIVRTTKLGVYLNAGRESSVASTLLGLGLGLTQSFHDPSHGADLGDGVVPAIAGGDWGGRVAWPCH